MSAPTLADLVAERDRLRNRLGRARTHAEELALRRRVLDAEAAVRRQERVEKAAEKP